MSGPSKRIFFFLFWLSGTGCAVRSDCSTATPLAESYLFTQSLAHLSLAVPSSWLLQLAVALCGKARERSCACGPRAVPPPCCVPWSQRLWISTSNSTRRCTCSGVGSLRLFTLVGPKCTGNVLWPALMRCWCRSYGPRRPRDVA